MVEVADVKRIVLDEKSKSEVLAYYGISIDFSAFRARVESEDKTSDMARSMGSALSSLRNEVVPKSESAVLRSAANAAYKTAIKLLGDSADAEKAKALAVQFLDASAEKGSTFAKDKVLSYLDALTKGAVDEEED